MGFLEDLGVEGIPQINLTGFLSSTWIYVFLIVIAGFILIVGAGVLFFFMTYKKKVILFENISGQGYQPILKTRARIVKLGIGGEELLKTLAGGHYISAYGRKMGHNTYWYAKGQDGYWYNIVLGDLDTKQAMLDIEPIDRDVRMFHVALDRLSHQTYGKTSLLEKYAPYMLLFVFLVVLILGMWFIVGKIGEATAPLGQSTELTIKMQEAHERTIQKLDNLIRAMGHLPDSFKEGSGLVPAT
jgi:hypothetical protein